MSINSVNLKFSGVITATAPIYISRHVKNNWSLSEIVIRDDRPVRYPVLPGETIKGVLRGTAYLLSTAAAQAIDPTIQTSLDKGYQQASGGREFEKGTGIIGSTHDVRAREPILSVFGAAAPKLEGKLIVHKATGLTPAVERDLPEGWRRDPFVANPELSAILSEDGAEQWYKEREITDAGAPLGRAVRNAERDLFAARKRARDKKEPTDSPAIMKLQAEYDAAKAAHDAFKTKHRDDKEDPTNPNSFQRQVPGKPAIPEGTRFRHTLELRGASLEEAGLLLATLRAWGGNCRIGGGRSTGYGQLDVNYNIFAALNDPYGLKGFEGGRVGTLRLASRDAPNPEGVNADQEDGTFPRGLVANDPVIDLAVAAWESAAAELLDRFDIFKIA